MKLRYLQHAILTSLGFLCNYYNLDMRLMPLSQHYIYSTYFLFFRSI